MYNIVKTSISNSGFVCLGEQHSKFTNFHVALRFIIYLDNNRKTKQEVRRLLL